MAETTARIRRYRPQDEKLVRFSIGRAVMEGLALANTKSTPPTFLHRRVHPPQLTKIPSLHTSCDPWHMDCTFVHAD